MRGRLEHLRQRIVRWFPDRHVYVRSGGEIRSFVLSPATQLAAAGALGAVLTWTLISTGSMVAAGFAAHADDQVAAKTKAYYERLIADRQARLTSAVAELTQNTGSIDGLAASIEKRHAALALLMSEVKGAPGAAAVLTPVQPSALASRSPVEQIRAVRADQDRLVDAAENFAKTRADRLRLAFRLAGLDAQSYAGRGVGEEGLGGPLIEARDPAALAAILDVDDDFAERIQTAARDLDAMRNLHDAAERMPLGKPLDAAIKSSGYGVRFDPFTRRPAFHAGQDFAGTYMTPVRATAPGVVAFVGVRAGYGNTVEIDHGRGFKTRYAHLAGAAVAPGQKVGVGQRIGAMGSTGRSTGVHLHYEVWQNGRVQNPTRFLRAGEYVQQEAASAG